MLLLLLSGRGEIRRVGRCVHESKQPGQVPDDRTRAERRYAISMCTIAMDCPVQHSHTPHSHQQQLRQHSHSRSHSQPSHERIWAVVRPLFSSPRGNMTRARPRDGRLDSVLGMCQLFGLSMFWSAIQMTDIRRRIHQFVSMYIVST
jgi:hypothetical protein